MSVCYRLRKAQKLNWYLANFGQDEDLTQFEEQQHNKHIPQFSPLCETFLVFLTKNEH